MPETTTILSIEFRRRLNLLQAELYSLIETVETREQAIVVKDAVHRPLGGMVKNFNLYPEKCHKCSDRQRRQNEKKKESDNNPKFPLTYQENITYNRSD